MVEFNPAAERTFGYSRDEVIGRELAEFIIPPSLRERHRRGHGSLPWLRAKVRSLASGSNFLPCEQTGLSFLPN